MLVPANDGKYRVMEDGKDIVDSTEAPFISIYKKTCATVSRPPQAP